MRHSVRLYDRLTAGALADGVAHVEITGARAAEAAQADAAGQLIGAAAQAVTALVGGEVAEVRAAQYPLGIEAEILVAVGIAQAGLIAVAAGVLINRPGIRLLYRLAGDRIVIKGRDRRGVEGIAARPAVTVGGVENPNCPGARLHRRR